MGDKKPDFSNVTGGSSTTAGRKPGFSDVTGGSSSTASSPDVRTYEVVAGDSLSKIAKREYGDANAWRRIFEANRDIIDDPDRIYPGQKLKIPPK